LFSPPKRWPNSPTPVDVVVLAVDHDYSQHLSRAVGRLAQDLRDRTIAVHFTPELEVLFVQSKIPLEEVVGIPVCSSQVPTHTGDLKQSLREWLNRYARGRGLDAKLRQEVAQNLEIRENSYLNAVGGWNDLVRGLETCVDKCT
jgi:hypothetical protein